MLNSFSVKERPLPTAPQRAFTFPSNVNVGPTSQLLFAHAHNAYQHVYDTWQDNINLYLGKKKLCLFESLFSLLPELPVWVRGS